jgi:hypothetical protein
LIRNQDAADIPGDASPDCANAFFFGGVRGLLGPRYGKTYVGLAEARIVGIYPYHVQSLGRDGLLVAMADGRTVFLSGYTAAVPSGTFINAASSATFNTTLQAGPVNIIINQFGQVVNVQWNNGVNGGTKTIIQCVPVFDSDDCTITYNKWTWVFTNGIFISCTLEENQVACSDDDDFGI